jgi:hypothetical protein
MVYNVLFAHVMFSLREPLSEVYFNPYLKYGNSAHINLWLSSTYIVGLHTQATYLLRSIDP